MPEPKPKMFEHPKFDGTIEISLDNDLENFSSGSMRLTIDGADVSEDGNALGRIANVIPAGISVTIGSRDWFFSPTALWNAAQQADAAYAAKLKAGR